MNMIKMLYEYMNILHWSNILSNLGVLIKQTLKLLSPLSCGTSLTRIGLSQSSVLDNRNKKQGNLYSIKMQ